MLTGDPPFTGSTAQAIVARVDHRAAPLAHRPAAHHAARTSKPRCCTALEKLPADRFATAAEFAAALVNPGYASAATRALPALPSRSRRSRALGALGWAVAAVAAGAAVWGWRRPVPARPVLRYVMTLPAEEQLVEKRGNRIAISPDGSRLVYVGPGPEGSQLWLRPRNQLHAAPIPGTDRATIPFFSPDGDRVGFVLDGNTAMKVVTFNGAPPITIADSGLGADGATWSSDGFIYYDGLTGGGTTGLVRVAATGGRSEQLTTVDTATRRGRPLLARRAPGRPRRALHRPAAEQPGGEQRGGARPPERGRITRWSRPSAARYAASGHLVYVTSDGDPDGGAVRPRSPRGRR